MPISDLFATLRWWVIVSFLGILAIPIAYRVLGRLPDRGYAYSKLIGLLLASYLFWILASLGFVQNTTGGILISLVLVFIASLWAIRHEIQATKPIGLRDIRTIKWLRENWSYVAIAEVLFALLFVLWTWVRSQNPTILGTEKPMEFAFLNSSSQSPTYPPLDPWLSGFSISYYYFGYVMTSVLSRLSVVQEAVGFNLAIAWLLAGTGLAAFGTVYNLLRAKADASRRIALTLGLVASLALPLAGNLEIGLEMLHANGVGSNAFWEWLDIRDLEAPATVEERPRYETSEWWWWRSSRVIHEYHLSGRPEENLEPIAEFPSFSFILGDLHPHVLALPYAFLSMAVALSWWMRGKNLSTGADDRFTNLPLAWQRASSLVDAPLFLFTALVLGGLAFLNTWDVLIHLFLITGSFLLGRLRSVGSWNWRIFKEATLFAGSLSIIAVLLFLPFFLGFRSQAGPPFILPMLMRPSRLAHYLVIFGLPIGTILVFVSSLSGREEVRPRLRSREAGRAVLLVIGLVGALIILQMFMVFVLAANPYDTTVIQSLALENNIDLTPMAESPTSFERVVWALRTLAQVSPSLLSIRLMYPALILFLVALAGLVTYRLLTDPSSDPASSAKDGAQSTTPFILLLILLGILLSLGPEFVYLKDNFGQRLNTIFKFYYQAWVMFGVSALFAIGYLVSKRPAVGYVLATGYALTLILVLFFPIYAVRSRSVEFRGPLRADERIAPTLDGLAHLRLRQPDEYDAIAWLKNNFNDTPTIVEAVGGSYTGYGRVSASTGFPTLLGWPGHEFQWRGSTEEPGRRETAVDNLYEAKEWGNLSDIMDGYGVKLLYFGNLENNLYGTGARRFFDSYLSPIYRNDTVTIYQWYR